MATFNSTLTAPRASAKPGLVLASQYAGSYRVAKGSFAGDAAQNDVVELFTLPAHATLSHLLSHVRHSAFGASVVLDIGVKADPSIIMANGTGYAGDDDCIADGLDVAAAGTKTFFAQAAVTDFNKKLWEIAGIDSGDPKRELTIIATFKGANPADGQLGFEQGWVTD